MDYISKVKRNKRRFLGFSRPKTEYQKRKESVVMDFLFFQKKIQKKKRLNEFLKSDIEKYIEFKRNQNQNSEATLKEKKSIISSFYKRNYLNLFES